MAKCCVHHETVKETKSLKSSNEDFRLNECVSFTFPLRNLGRNLRLFLL